MSESYQLTGAKVLAIVSLLTRSSWATSKWAQPFLPNGNEASGDPEEDQRALMRGLIEDSAGGDSYTDDASELPSTSHALVAAPNSGTSGPIVQPSQLIDVENEWHNEGEEHRA